MSEFSARNEDEDEVVEVSAEGSIAAPSVPAFDTSETEIKDIKLASAYKEEGNELYRNQDYDGSIEKYSFAILHCPNDDVENKAVFLGNRAAAYHSIEEYRQVVDDCTAALELKPDYIKVLYRRSQAEEKLDRIEDALNDLKKIKEIDSNFNKINENIARLEKLYEVKMEQLKTETFGKLKELGNSILGNFGLSLDNFKMQQDPATGSWSINMGNK